MNGGGLVALQALQEAPPLDTGLGAVRAVFALVAVLVALAGFLWLLKRGTFVAWRGRGVQSGLAVESAVSLGDRRSLVIVSVDGRRLLLGLSAMQISLITELTGRPASFGAALDGALAPPGERR